jgi:hypothetical protein
MICSSVQGGILNVIVVGYEAYSKPIREKQGSGKWGFY